MVFISEFSATMLSVTAFFSLLLYFQLFNIHLFVYGFALVLSLFAREIYKDLKSIRGDVIFGYKSIATTVGIGPGIRIFQLILFLSMVVDLSLPFLLAKKPMEITVMALGVIKFFCLWFIRLDILKRKKIVHRLIQLMIAVYILGIAWL